MINKLPLLLLVLGFSLNVSTVWGQTECAGIGWYSFSDEKCIKILDTPLATHAEAELQCIAETEGSSETSTLPPLLTIKSSDEQAFLTNYLFDELNIVDNIWLGASRLDETQFAWSDGAPFQFTHWRAGSPSINLENACVQMTPAIARHGIRNSSKAEGDGFWTDVSCQRRNLAICQKLPVWSLLHLQKSFIDLRRNPIPVGFIYVQLPDQPDANTAWPKLGWADVTAQYAGLFFRAEGGGSEVFGTPQVDQTRRITEFSYTVRDDASGGVFPDATVVPPTGYSEFGRAGEVYDSGATTVIVHEALRFLTDDVEVRPRNTAVRIWKRIY